LDAGCHLDGETISYLKNCGGHFLIFLVEIFWVYFIFYLSSFTDDIISHCPLTWTFDILPLTTNHSILCDTRIVISVCNLVVITCTCWNHKFLQSVHQIKIWS
jgi:hypothetical protein